MGDSIPFQGEQEELLYESIRSRPVTPATVLHVNAGASREPTRHEERCHDHIQLVPTDPFQLHKPQSSGATARSGESYGLRILGYTGPINQRPVSAVSRLRVIDEEPSVNVHTTTDEHGDILEVSDSFQKLKIARNQSGQYCGAGDGPGSRYDDGVYSPRTGITIKSLTSNTIVHVPETHHNIASSSKSKDRISSGDEVRIHPNGINKSKLSKTRRRRRIKFVKGEAQSATVGVRSISSTSFANGFTGVGQNDADSDVGGSDRDYSVPSTARSTYFDQFELQRPETASSVVLLDGALASTEGDKIKNLMKILGMDEDEQDWYTTGEEIDETMKHNLLKLTKSFYLREARNTEHGLLHTYKLLLGGLHNRLEDFVLLPVPPGFTIKMQITRVKKGIAGRFHPQYYMHLVREDVGDRKCLILMGKKHKYFGGAGFLITTESSEVFEQSEYCVGKVSSNIIGTEYTIYSGRSICAHIPPERGALMALPKAERFQEELATVLYDTNLLGFKGPRRMKVIIPKMKNLLERESVRPRICEESLLQQHQHGETSQIWSLKNKDPIWNRDTHSFILNFSGRVTEASVKNFQIVREDHDEDVLLQFGRVSDSTFSLDFQYPFCPLQAFAIALTSFDSKIACE